MSDDTEQIHIDIGECRDGEYISLCIRQPNEPDFELNLDRECAIDIAIEILKIARNLM